MLSALGINFVPTVSIGNLLVILVIVFGGIAVAWIKTRPAALTADNERQVIDNADTSSRFGEFRDEVRGLRGELAVVRAELLSTQTESARRNDKLNMVLFILRMVMDELHAKDKGNRVLGQAMNLLRRVEDEPHALDNSATLTAAENAHEATGATVREVKADEAKGDGK